MREPYKLKLIIRELPAASSNDRQHYRERHAETKHWDEVVHFMTVGRRPKKPLKKARLTLTRHSAQRMDFDNMAISWKHPVDALVSCGILEDDCWEVIGMPDIRYEHAPNGQGFIEMDVEEIE